MTSLPDVGDQREFIAAAALIFADYPEAAMVSAVHRIASASDRPTLKLMREVLEEAYAPMRREDERQRVRLENNKFDTPVRLQPPDYSSRRPGRRANLLVHADAPQYSEACEWAKIADPADSKGDARGIWVNWLASPLSSTKCSGNVNFDRSREVG